jgi:hypothetical protein
MSYPFLICAVLLNARHAVNAANGMAAASCDSKAVNYLVWANYAYGSNISAKVKSGK